MCAQYCRSRSKDCRKSRCKFPGTTLARLLRRGRLDALLRDEAGNVLVEAALVFPILVGLFLGVSEFSEAFTVSRRLDVAAFAAADLVAREQAVTTDDLTAVKKLIDETVKPFPLGSLGLIITSVVADDDNATTVAWSHAMGSGVSPYGTGVAIALPAGLTFPKTSVVLAEVKYQFRSTLSTLIVGSVPLRATAYQTPRFSGFVVRK